MKINMICITNCTRNKKLKVCTTIQIVTGVKVIIENFSPEVGKTEGLIN